MVRLLALPIAKQGIHQQIISSMTLVSWNRSSRLSVARRHHARVSAMLSKFERYPLTFGPTPIEKLSRLTAHLGGDVEIFAKREDCNSGLAFGGNKLRKLEYIVPDAISSNADT